MADMSLTKTPIAEQPPEERVCNFKEVTLGYTAEEAIKEAGRCLNCKNKPCTTGCPVNVRIPEFIGRVCPQENQCEGKCVRGIKGEPVGIGRLERFCADYMMEKRKTAEKPAPNGHKVAVVGAGPSSLTVAGDLAKLGYEVTVYEAFHTAGGVLMYGIPEFRLPKEIVRKEIKSLEDLGVKIMTNMVIGKVLSIDELIDMGNEAIFIGSGAGLPRFMGIEGENLVGVYSANEYLTRINLMKAYKDGYETPILNSKSVAVVGGGNVAMDSARSARRMGAEKVYVVYRRSMEEIPARKEEVHHAIEEGIEFKMLNNPVRILGDENDRVKGIEVVSMELGEPDASGRRSPVEIKGSEHTIDVDTVIIAIGTSPNPLIKKTTPGPETNKRGCIVADDAGATSREGVFAGGDAVTGAATVILAMGAGKTAAAAIDEYFKNK